jgi:hypothetical protein
VLFLDNYFEKSFGPAESAARSRILSCFTPELLLFLTKTLLKDLLSSGSFDISF